MPRSSARLRDSQSKRNGGLDSGEGILGALELRIVLLLAALSVLGARLLVGILGGTVGLFLVDFRHWAPVASPQEASGDLAGMTYQEFYRTLQAGPGVREAFRLVLELQGPPEPGRFVGAKRRFVVEEGSEYCFSVFTWSPYSNPTSRFALEMFSTRILVNGEVRAQMAIADRSSPRWIRIEGILPVEGEIEVRFEVRSQNIRRRESWRRASRVYFEFASLTRCESAGGRSP
jgi:hypothetical protein